MQNLKNKRSKCIGNCGRLVIGSTECRKCRRLRMRAGAKIVYKLHRKRSHSLIGRVMNFFATKKEQFTHSKSLYWNRPKLTGRRYSLNIHQRYPTRPGTW